jgi:hypothetical protein
MNVTNKPLHRVHAGRSSVGVRERTERLIKDISNWPPEQRADRLEHLARVFADTIDIEQRERLQR